MEKNIIGKERGNNMCKFSIIIPNYNKEKYIKDCLDSIYNQDISEDKYEVILIDDGSTDNSLEIIKNYPVKLFKTNRKRAGGARNVGLNSAEGEYIIFIDSDDYLSNNFVLKKLDDIITNQDIIFLNFTKNDFGKEELIQEKNTSISEKIEKTKLLGCPTKCFKRSLIDNTRFTEYTAYEDVYFTLECLCKCKTYDYFKESFFTYRKVENSNTTQEVSGKIMTDLLLEISKLYYLCFKYPIYKENILNRIVNDKLDVRLEVLNELIKNDNNTFRKFF